MKGALTLLPGAALVAALAFSSPALAAEHPSGMRPMATHAAAFRGSSAEARGTRDADARDFDRPFAFRGFDGGFLWAPWYDAWWPGYYGVAPWYYGYDNSGGLKLKITGPNPKSADVYANGGYVGTVDDFNGTFQQLTLPPGPYNIEVRADGYRPLNVKVRIQPDKTITYRAQMHKLA